MTSTNYTTPTSNGTAEVTASVSWGAGDLVIVVGVTEDNTIITLGTPTASGLTFSSVTLTNTANNCKCYCWQATAATAGSGAISSVVTTDGSDHAAGITVFSISGSSGIGNTALLASTTTTNATVSLTRGSPNSGVILAFGDWSAVNDTAVATSPSSAGTVDIIVNSSGRYTAYVAHWTDQGATGSTSYGIGSYTATPKWIGLVVEIKGVDINVSPKGKSSQFGNSQGGVNRSVAAGSLYDASFADRFRTGWELLRGLRRFNPGFVNRLRTQTDRPKLGRHAKRMARKAEQMCHIL